jgi:hypothetical protein
LFIPKYTDPPPKKIIILYTITISIFGNKFITSFVVHAVLVVLVVSVNVITATTTTPATATTLALTLATEPVATHPRQQPPLGLLPKLPYYPQLTIWYDNSNYCKKK